MFKVEIYSIMLHTTFERLHPCWKHFHILRGLSYCQGRYLFYRIPLILLTHGMENSILLYHSYGEILYVSTQELSHPEFNGACSHVRGYGIAA